MENISKEPIDRESIAKTIRFLRTVVGLTQKELAERANINSSTLYFAETGRPVRIQSLKRIAHALGGNIDDLLTKHESLQTPSNDGIYAFHKSEQTVWHTAADRRAKILPEYHYQIQNPEERLRLGRLGLVPAFFRHFSFALPDGPGMLIHEIYEAIPYGEVGGTYKDQIMHCLRGELLLTTAEKVIHLRQGDAVACGNVVTQIAPAHKVGPHDLAPLLEVIAANRIHKPSARRRRPKSVERKT